MEVAEAVLYEDDLKLLVPHLEVPEPKHHVAPAVAQVLAHA